MNSSNNTSIRLVRYFLVLAITLPLFAGCKGKQDVTQKRGVQNIRNTETLIAKMRENEFSPDWLSLKLAVAFETPDASDSFKMYVRMKKDSVIWVSTTYYAVEVARLMITKDSVRFMDRKDDRYYEGEVGFLSDSFNLDFNFYSLQALLLGNSIGIDDSTKIRSYSKNNQYQLSSVKKRQLRKAEERGMKDEEVAYSNWLNPATFKVERVSVFDLRTSRSMEINYSNFDELEGQLFPQKLDLMLAKSGESTSVTIDYQKVNNEGPYKLSFRIPEKYERINP